MSKERRTVSVDPEVEAYLSGQGVNASQLVNKLVKNHATSGGDKRSMLELRKEQLVSDIEELESRREMKTKELERVEEKLSEFETEREKTLRQAREALDKTDVIRETQAFGYWCDELDMSVDELAAEIDGTT